MSSVIEIVLNAKNAASAKIEEVGKSMNTMASDAKCASIGAASGLDAVSKAMRGDFVGAANSARNAIQQLGKAIMSNPWMAVAAAIGLAVVKLVEFYRKQQQIAQEVAKMREQFSSDNKKAYEIVNGTQLDHVKADVRGAENGMTLDDADKYAAVHMETAKADVDTAMDQQARWAERAIKATKEGNDAEKDHAEKQHALWLEELARRKAIYDEYAGMAERLKEKRISLAEAEAEAIAKIEADKAEAERVAGIEAMEESANRLREEQRLAEEAAKREMAMAEELLKEKIRLKDLEAKAAQEAAAAELKSASESYDQQKAYVADLEEAWSQRGIGGIKERKQERREAKAAEREERGLQRQIERWNDGRRDSAATAAHQIDLARQLSAILASEKKAAEDAKKRADEAADAKKLKAIEECRDRIAELNSALIGG